MNKLKVCIVGSSGYIGSHLAFNLVKDFHIIAHSRKKIKDKKFYTNISSIIIGNIKSENTLKKILKIKPDVIVYTISFNHFKSEDNLSDSIKNNYEPFQNLVEKIVSNKLKIKLIYFSTMQVYGRSFKKNLITEKYPKNIQNIYSLTHSMCEDLLQAYQKNLNYNILRLSNSFGIPQISGLNCWWPVLNDLCKSAKKNKKIIINSDGSPLRDFISLNDITKFIIILIKKNLQQKIINLCSSETISIKELALKIHKNFYFKKKIPIIFKKKPTEIKKKRFRYCNKIMLKHGFKKTDTFENQIANFLSKI